MEFKERRGIYLQIADSLGDRILAGEWGEEDRIPSIREIAAELGVNPNTVIRSYGFLQDRGILLNKRGIGYFLNPESREKVLDWKREDFIQRDLPMVFKAMDQLELKVSDLEKYYKTYKEGSDEVE